MADRLEAGVLCGNHMRPGGEAPDQPNGLWPSGLYRRCHRVLIWPIGQIGVLCRNQMIVVAGDPRMHEKLTTGCRSGMRRGVRAQRDAR